MKKLIPFVALALFAMSTVSVAQTPVISYSGSNDVCASCVTLNVTNPQPNFSYTWFVGNYSCGSATGSVNYGSGTTIQACGTGEYYCLGTNPNGVQYISNPLTIRSLPGSIGSSLLPKPYHTDPVVCMDSVQLCIPSVFYSSFPNTTFTWYKNGVAIPGANGSSYLATSNGNYTYSVTSSCTTAFSSGVDIFPVPIDPQVTSVTPVPVCTQDTVVFQIVNPQPNYFYEWQRFFQGTSYLTIGYGSSVSYPVISNAYDTLKVRVKQTAIGCIKYSDDYIVPLQNNNPTITPNGTVAICGGTSKTLTGYPGSTNPGYTYQWYKNGNPLSGAVFATYNATSAGSYTVATTTTCGTNVSAATVITVLPAPTVTISAGGPTTFCKPDSVKLSSTVSGTGPFTYQWKNYGVNILGALSANYMVGKTGKYKLRVTDANGCGRTSNQIDVTANPLPVASISANGPTIFCSGDSVVLSAALVAGQTYQWKRYSNLISGATSTNYTVKFAGKYRCVVTNTFGCTRTSNTLDVFVPCREAAAPEDGLPYLHASVYPNPTSENFTLSLTASEEGTALIRVFDMTGRLMQPEIVPTGEAQFEISGLQSGIYIAEITMNGIRETVRLIKTN